MPEWSQKLSYCIANVTAVLVALYIALWLDLDRPYWAMFTVFIVSKPISGAVRSKGVYRFIGTLVGASMSVFLVPPLVQSPVLLSLAVSIWVAGCLYGALQDRTPRNYAFLLAGYSVAIVGLSTVNNPTAIFDVAVSRLEEITIGIVCATIAHSVFFPNNYGDILRRKAETAIRQSAAIAAAAIARDARPPKASDIATLSNTVTELHTLYSQIGFETSNVRRVPEIMVGLLDRLATILPKASLAYRAMRERELVGAASETLRSDLDETVAALLQFSQGNSPNTDEILADLEASSEMLDEEGDATETLLELTCVRHTIDIVWALRECMLLAPGLTDPGAAAGTKALTAKTTVRPLYCDQFLAMLSALAAAAATLVACYLWIETAWPEGFVAAQFAAICCSLFATLDNPSKVIGAAVAAIILALPVAAIYVFAILPNIDGFPSLALVLCPVLLFFSFLQTFERLEGAGLVLAIAFSAALALQANFSSDFASFVNSNLSEICGPLIAIAMLMIFRTIDPVWNAKRILKSARQSVGDLPSHMKDPAAWLLQIFDRIGLAASRLLPSEDAVSRDLLGDMRVGLNLVALHEVEEGVGAALLAAIQEFTDQVCSLYSAGYHRATAFAKGRAVDRAETLITQLSSLPHTDDTVRGVVALQGLRLDLRAMIADGMPA